MGDTSQMPFLRYYPEPAAVLVAQILCQVQAAAAEAPSQMEPPAPPEEDPWGEDGDIVRSWFEQGDELSTQAALDADQGGPHA